VPHPSALRPGRTTRCIPGIIVGCRLGLRLLGNLHRLLGRPGRHLPGLHQPARQLAGNLRRDSGRL